MLKKIMEDQVMKIVHCCLSNYYIDDYNYQENLLPIFNQKNGNQVLIVASTETFLENKKLGYVKAGKFKTKEGIDLVRLDYSKLLPRIIMKKIRLYKGLKRILTEFDPDVILFHGLPAFELINVANYKKNNSRVKFYLDSHEDYHNSGRNLLSKYILHRLLYRSVIKLTKRYFDCVYYISLETKKFIEENYRYFGKSLFLPLGGEVLSDSEYNSKRDRFRNKYNIGKDEIVFFHSGKLDKSKKTIELLSSYIQSKTSSRLFIAGSVSEDIKLEFNNLVSISKSIVFLGWLNSAEISDAFCGSDIYLQPGTQSVSMQQALCSRCVAALYPYSSHEFLLGDDYLRIENASDMYKLFVDIGSGKYDLNSIRIKVHSIALDILDYNKQSKMYLK